MIKLSKEKRYKLEKEIEFWLKHWDLDKFNYDRTISNFIASMAILITSFIGLVAIVFSLKELNLLIVLGGIQIISIKNLIIIIFSIIVMVWGLNIKNSYQKEINQNNISFMVRDEHLRRMYGDLAKVDKRKLNTEFEDIKKDYLNGKIKLPYS